MKPSDFNEIIAAGEGLHAEFKEARDRLPGSFFDTVCAFLNTDGGTIYLGVGDNGAVTGVEPRAVARLKSDIANLSNNPRQLDPPFLLFPHAVTVDGKTVITVQVPLSSQIHRPGGEIVLRSEDGDYRLRGTHQLAGLANRKLSLFSEQRVLPHLTLADLRRDLFDKARSLMRAGNRRHPWLAFSDEELPTGITPAPPRPPSKSTLTLPLVVAPDGQGERVIQQVTPEVTPEVRAMLSVLIAAMSRGEIMNKLGLTDEKHFRKHYQQTSIKLGLIEMTIPDKPTSSKQKYRLTEKGKQLLREAT